MLAGNLKCSGCQQKAKKELSLDGVHFVPYCGYKFCLDKLTKKLKD